MILNGAVTINLHTFQIETQIALREKMLENFRPGFHTSQERHQMPHAILFRWCVCFSDIFHLESLWLIVSVREGKLCDEEHFWWSLKQSGLTYWSPECFSWQNYSSYHLHL